MLTNPELVKVIFFKMYLTKKKKIMTRVLSICIVFASHTDQFIKTLNLENNDNYSQTSSEKSGEKQSSNFAQERQYKQMRLRVSSEQAKKQLTDERFVRSLMKLDSNFTFYLKQLTEAVTILSTQEANQHLSNLVQQLDYNNYYKQYFEKNPLLSVSNPQPPSSLKTKSGSFSSSLKSTTPSLSSFPPVEKK